jgi:HK97 family phage portal protein
VLRAHPQTLAELDAQIESQGVSTYAGKEVTEKLALNLSAVWCAVLNISTTIASLPLKLYQRQRTGRKEYPTHPLYDVLQTQPNSEMDAFVFREIMQRHVLLWGNAYARIQRNGTADRVIALWPINPSIVTIGRVNGKVVYIQKNPDGTKIVHPAKDIFHILGPSFNGRVGYSVITFAAKQSMGIALAADEHAGRVFDNFATPRGVLKYPGKFHDREKATKRQS